MEEYFYFTMYYNDTGESRFMGDVAEHRWESWEQAVEFSNSEYNMPLKYQWKIDGDHLVANSIFGSDITIQINSTGYEQHYNALANANLQ